LKLSCGASDPDNLGNVDLVTEKDGYAYEFFVYTPWGPVKDLDRNQSLDVLDEVPSMDQ
jgi:hypothetical protein